MSTSQPQRRLARVCLGAVITVLYLLVPTIKTDEGEWEARHVANWLAGARRYATFFELLMHERERLLILLKEAPAPIDKPPARWRPASRLAPT